ncbi:DUF4240 domain-containing protein [Streptomyces roseoviridis]|uniref:DUF4240 domain-containing protein n=1 Tax=Streptomyces roseoviridis TaxID=67361 RepID=A0ABV5QQK9_9ACTN
MDERAFWALMGGLRDRPGRREERLDWLREELTRASFAGCAGFQVQLEQACHRAYRSPVWSAAERILGGWCSDDSFHYFRLWLVALGREVFEEALMRPDSLAGVPEVRRLAGRSRSSWCETEEWPDWEDLDYVAVEAYGALAGGSQAFHELVTNGHGDRLPDPEAPPYEEPLEADDLPRLAALFPVRPPSV